MVGMDYDNDVGNWCCGEGISFCHFYCACFLLVVSLTEA